jgi:hypothetical protein
MSELQDPRVTQNAMLIFMYLLYDSKQKIVASKREDNIHFDDFKLTPEETLNP